MSQRWQIFILLEGLLGLFFLYQMFTTPVALAMTIIGGLLLLWGTKRHFGRRVALLVGGVLLTLAVATNAAIWMMLAVAMIFFATSMWGANPAGTWPMPWVQKHFLTLKTKEPPLRNGSRTRHAWFGDTTIGDQAFAWDDINMTVFSGDTIIDLGNTLLPPNDNAIVIRKGFGKTRILVPIGVGIEINHSAIHGQLHVNGVDYLMQNETLVQYSDDFDTAPRRIRLITSTIVGDVEVMFV
ncbi:cell wall-active antibiotics response protein LiaF [Lacticaseibacillus brantae]|uniref:Uncharacterized protein n=1 Tax=Lacticaseibacillus brantae DSM 23927 TaxID=1423727 RepID=A0A0R2B0V1_9LACO|nr:cell wall-active antibiotics response protein LiaF [Lacticaseibacillus brantae]KRM72847.1 hypothetical protein FC34_GL000559 [Lacticaseibacillus brantae DSM 23927]